MTSLAGIVECPSCNHTERRNGAVADMLILHYTGMTSAAAAIERLSNPESGVSCHYLIDEDGQITRMVEEDRRAWHAGRSIWSGTRDINSCSIGVEIQNTGHDHGYPDFPQPQMEAVLALCRDIIGRHSIVPHRVLAHSDIAPGRKIDPGEKFDWAWLAGEGVGHWVEPEPVGAGGGGFLQCGDQGQPVEALQSMLATYGYGIEITGVFDGVTGQVVAAFQRHFRPEMVDGVADASTVATLHRLLLALPNLPQG